jgi:hypothetical protein
MKVQTSTPRLSQLQRKGQIPTLIQPTGMNNQPPERTADFYAIRKQKSEKTKM